MRLYNKTLREIWGDMPAPYRVVVAVSAAFIVFSLVYLTTGAVKSLAQSAQGSKGALEIVGARAVNLLDPALASDGRELTAMVYTGIEPQSQTDGATLKISMALSDLPCGRWRWSDDLFIDRAESLLAPDGVSTLAQGRVRYETPSIVYDAADTQAPWKIFAYRYFWMGDTAFAQRYSGIVMRSASSVFGPWSQEEWLLATAPDYPPPPYQNLVRGHINPMSPELAGISGYARPSVVADRGVLLMSLAAFAGSTDIDRVILLASLDHGRRWVYAGTLLTRAQVAEIGAFTRISGASLLRQGQAIYLAAVLGDQNVAGLGTYLFRIADPAKAKLLATAGIAAPVRHIPRQSQQPTSFGGGYAAFDDNCPIGIVTSEHSGLRNAYQLFSTDISPADPQ